MREIRKLVNDHPHELETVSLENKKALLFTEGEFDTNNLDFIRILPSKDYALWYAGLILRKHFNEGDKETVTQIKTDMMNIDIIRGKNIANLCSAGYLESDIIPTFNSLSENQKMQDFLPYYEQLVTQTPTSIFISNKHNSTSLKNEVLEKIEFAKKYSAQSVRLYALSEKNVSLGKTIIAELSERTKKEKIIYNLDRESRLEVTILVK